MPRHDENRMRQEGDLVTARRRFLDTRFNNLDVLLEQRFGWMDEHIHENDEIIEFGCGPGFSQLYVKNGHLTLTDVTENEWVDQIADAMNPPFEPESVDVIICSHMIHHMAHPVTFFKLVHSILRPGGRIIIQDINTAWMMRVMLRAMRHEGWSYEIDVFDETVVTNDPEDPWSANCAIPQLLFKSTEEFEAKVPGYRVRLNEVNECLLFPLSGGVIARANVPQLPRWLLKSVQWIDRGLVKVAPGAFALGRSVVLEKQAIQ